MEEKKVNKPLKRIAALVCVILLLSLSVALFAVAVMDFPGKEQVFMSCLMAVVGLPIILWIYIYLYKKVKETRSSSKEQGGD